MLFRSTINTVSGGRGVGASESTFNDCTITIDTVNSHSTGITDNGIYGGTFNNCAIAFNTIDGANGSGIVSRKSTFNNCVITVDTANNNSVSNGTFNNCAIAFNTIGRYGYGVFGGTFNNCAITINTIEDTNGVGVSNDARVRLYLTKIKCSIITDLSSTSGKLNILNDTVFHAS